MERTATECEQFARPFGKSPAMIVLDALNANNRRMAFMLSEDAHRLILAASFWEQRKVRGVMALFALGHNVHCHWRAQHYRNLLAIEIERAARK